MKHTTISFWAVLVLCAGLFLPSMAHAKGGIPIFYSTGSEQLAKVTEFPQAEQFTDSRGVHFDAGIMYKQVSLMFVPLWNYDVQWCGYIDDENYVQLTKEELDELAKSAGVTLPASGKIPMWHAFGGKIIVGLLLAGIAAFLLMPSKGDDDDDSKESGKEAEVA